MASFDDWMVPYNVVLEGEVALRPPLKVMVPSACPNVRVPVLLKVTALVIVPPVPVNLKAYAPALTVRVGVVTAPWKSTKTFDALITTEVFVLTAPVKVAVPQSVMVRVPTLVTVVPLISAPVMWPVFKVRLKPAPVTAPMVMSATLVVAWVFMVVLAEHLVSSFSFLEF